MHSPSTGTLALTAIGTPANGRTSPGWIASAAASARSPSTSTNAFRSPSSASIRSRLASTSSRADELTAPDPGRQIAGRREHEIAGGHGAGRIRDRPRLVFRLSPNPLKGPSHERSPVRLGRRRRLRHRDRRARQGGRGAPLPRREHRGARRSGPVRAGLGAARRRQARARPAARGAAPARGPLGRPARRRAVRAGHARAGVGLRAADRHLRRGRARPARPRLRDGALVRRAVRARRRPPAGPAERGRQGDVDPRAVPDPLARRGRPRPRQGDRRLLDLGRRARHERLDVHRARGRLDRARTSRPR